MKKIHISSIQYFYFILKNVFILLLINAILFFVLNNVRNQSNKNIEFSAICLLNFTVFFIFLILQKQRLSSISKILINSQTFIKIDYYKFLVFKKSMTIFLNNLSYSYKTEKLNKIGYREVLRIFENKNLVFSRENIFGGFDGFNDEQITSLTDFFDELGLKNLDIPSNIEKTSNITTLKPKLHP